MFLPKKTKAKIDMPGMTSGYHKVRVNFPCEITERKAVKEVIVSTLPVQYCDTMFVCERC